MESIVEKLKDAFIKGMRLPLKLMPLWIEAIGVGVFISTVVERNIRFRERLKEIDGKVFLFEARDINKSFYLCIEGNGIKVLPHIMGRPDAIMRGDVSVLTDVFLGLEDPDTVFFSRRLEISGDTAAAVHFKNILAAIS